MENAEVISERVLGTRRDNKLSTPHSLVWDRTGGLYRLICRLIDILSSIYILSWCRSKNLPNVVASDIKTSKTVLLLGVIVVVKGQ